MPLTKDDWNSLLELANYAVLSQFENYEIGTIVLSDITGRRVEPGDPKDIRPYGLIKISALNPNQGQVKIYYDSVNKRIDILTKKEPAYNFARRVEVFARKKFTQLELIVQTQSQIVMPPEVRFT